MISRRKILGSMALSAIPVARLAEQPIPTLDSKIAKLEPRDQAYVYMKLAAKAMKAAHGGRWAIGEQTPLTDDDKYLLYVQQF